jgi:hypothetical protein
VIFLRFSSSTDLVAAVVNVVYVVRHARRTITVRRLNVQDSAFVVRAAACSRNITEHSFSGRPKVATTKSKLMISGQLGVRMVAR